MITLLARITPDLRRPRAGGSLAPLAAATTPADNDPLLHAHEQAARCGPSQALRRCTTGSDSSHGTRHLGEGAGEFVIVHERAINQVAVDTGGRERAHLRREVDEAVLVQTRSTMDIGADGQDLPVDVLQGQLTAAKGTPRAVMDARTRDHEDAVLARHDPRSADSDGTHRHLDVRGHTLDLRERQLGREPDTGRAGTGERRGRGHVVHGNTGAQLSCSAALRGKGQLRDVAHGDRTTRSNPAIQARVVSLAADLVEDGDEPPLRRILR